MSNAIGEDLFKRVDYQPARKGEVLKTYCDVSLARRTLGYDPKTDLPVGLAATWAWFQSQMAKAD
jgi:UDP-glucose 4-epimerase